MVVSVHHLTHNPTAAWKEISREQKYVKIKYLPPAGSPQSNMVRFVCMSDTHSETPYMEFDIPNGDVFIHAGDFTHYGEEHEVTEFNDWLSSLPHKYKIVIAGNHELTFDEKFIRPVNKSNMCFRELLTNCIYLQDEGISLYGLKLYGTPWQPEFRGWAFNVPRGEECLKKWNMIPDDIDILVTHSPPLGHGDLCCTGVRAGCAELLSTVQKRVQPKYHIFGHIHEGYGISSDGKVIYINASTCDIRYQPNNPPIVFDVPLPPGALK